MDRITEASCGAIWRNIVQGVVEREDKIALRRAPPMGGEDELFEIDEALMRGHSRKNHRGRQTPYEIERRRALVDIVATRRAIARIPNAVYDDDDDDNSNRNYGVQTDGR